MLSFWDDSRFCCVSNWGIGGGVVINGFLRATGEEICLINVYAPCRLEEKLQLWDRILLVLEQRADANCCIIGDLTLS